ncbi:hypothetical protein CMV_027548, partial [Castanea mollissima]
RRWPLKVLDNISVGCLESLLSSSYSPWSRTRP